MDDPVRFLKCLADETRLATVLLLDREGELCVCDLVSALGVSQPLMSRHLSQLRHCGVVRARRDGKWMHYSLAPDLPPWGQSVIAALGTSEHNARPLATARSHCAA
jgi:ArsR family transcriptional regulator